MNNDMESERLSKYITQYIYFLKIDDKNEVYETVLLMLLNDSFLKALNNLVESNLKRMKQFKSKIKLNIQWTKEYKEAITSVCQSKYFVENFSKTEIERRRIIAENMIVEIAIQSGLNMFNDGVCTGANFYKVMYPNIEHEFLSSNSGPRIQIVFNEGTPLDDIVKYLKCVLEIKNKPKKRKLSLGQSFRMLQVSNEIKLKPLNYAKQKYEYNEQVIAREMMSRYKEKISVEAVAKSLQRIKKIKKEINIFQDK